MELSKADREAVTAAIRAAEQQTSGQIVCVLAQSSSDYAHVPIYFTQWSVQKIYVLQLAVFIIVGLVLAVTPLRFELVPASLKRARAHRAALEQFVVRRVAHTRNRSGILIFVSLAERYARIIADEGIAQKAGNAEWQAAIDALVSHMRDGRIAEGFIAAIERCGAVLATHAPPGGGPVNELPDRLYVV